jgi:hypothetical protein
MHIQEKSELDGEKFIGFAGHRRPANAISAPNTCDQSRNNISRRNDEAILDRNYIDRRVGGLRARRLVRDHGSA